MDLDRIESLMTTVRLQMEKVKTLGTILSHGISAGADTKYLLGLVDDIVKSATETNGSLDEISQRITGDRSITWEEFCAQEIKSYHGALKAFADRADINAMQLSRMVPKIKDDVRLSTLAKLVKASGGRVTKVMDFVSQEPETEEAATDS